MNRPVILKVEGLRAGYGKREVLRGIDLEVREGEIVVVVGPNGAGKSTLLKAIVGLADVWEGTIWFRSREGELVDITTMPVYDRVRMGMGYLMQDRNVFPGLTVEENLDLAGWRVDPAVRESRKREVWEMFPELAPLRHRRAGFLSGGQRQMLGLGMVWMQKPTLLLLDEPFSGVQAKDREAMWSLMDSGKLRAGATLLVEHRIKDPCSQRNICRTLRVGEGFKGTREHKGGV